VHIDDYGHEPGGEEQEVLLGGFEVTQERGFEYFEDSRQGGF
jgi:hypothetical protein